MIIKRVIRSLEPAAMTPMTIPVCYHNDDPEIRMNFQMNRWLGWVGKEGVPNEMQSGLN